MTIKIDRFFFWFEFTFFFFEILQLGEYIKQVQLKFNRLKPSKNEVNGWRSRNLFFQLSCFKYFRKISPALIRQTNMILFLDKF